jgi:toxin ParE1/3/4
VSPFEVSPEALEDLLSIWEFVAEDNRDAANRILRDFNDAFRLLANMPGLGHRRTDLTKRDLRFWTVYSYLIIYKQSDPVVIVAVLHGKRNVKKLLKAR